jgi:hypothetical protein
MTRPSARRTRIYRLFVEAGKTKAEIAEILNRAGAATCQPWTRGRVPQVLANEKYIGNNVYNRVSFKLKKRRVSIPVTQSRGRCKPSKRRTSICSHLPVSLPHVAGGDCSPLPWRRRCCLGS